MTGVPEIESDDDFHLELPLGTQHCTMCHRLFLLHFFLLILFFRLYLKDRCEDENKQERSNQGGSHHR